MGAYTFFVLTLSPGKMCLRFFYVYFKDNPNDFEVSRGQSEDGKSSRRGVCC